MGIDEERRAREVRRRGVRRTALLLALTAAAIYFAFLLSGIWHTANP